VPGRAAIGYPQVCAAGGADLGAEYDRSRCGTGPISSRRATDLGDQPAMKLPMRRAVVYTGAPSASHTA